MGGWVVGGVVIVQPFVFRRRGDEKKARSVEARRGEKVKFTLRDHGLGSDIRKGRELDEAGRGKQNGEGKNKTNKN